MTKTSKIDRNVYSKSVHLKQDPQNYGVVYFDNSTTAVIWPLDDIHDRVIVSNGTVVVFSNTNNYDVSFALL